HSFEWARFGEKARTRDGRHPRLARANAGGGAAMKQHALAQVTSASLWEWPVDIMSYDRTPWLSNEEHVALGSWIVSREREQGGRIPKHLKQTLHRLLLPIADVLDSTPIDESSRRGAIRFIVLGMHQR